MKTRPIEMYVGRAWAGGSSGEWWTGYVDIPIDTPEGAIDRVATDAMISQLLADSAEFVFVGVYHIPGLEGLEEEEDA